MKRANGVSNAGRAREDSPFSPITSRDECGESGARVAGKRNRKNRALGERGVTAVESMWGLLIGAVAVVILVPSFLHTTSSVDDADARANLQVAIIAAKSAYEVVQSYSYDGAPLTTLSFAADAPEFSWETGSCSGKASGCVSYQVVDVDSAGDSQGIVVAVWSPLTRTCWFGVDLETVPRPLMDDHSGLAFESQLAQSVSGSSGSAVAYAGVYTARSPAGTETCAAGSAINPGGLLWSQWGA